MTKTSDENAEEFLSVNVDDAFDQPWPKIGDRAFENPGKHTLSPDVAFPHHALMGRGDHRIAWGFKDAGDRIVATLGHIKPHCHSDHLFFPVAFLYRHALELQLKEIVRLGLRMEVFFDSEKLTKVLSGHSLMPIWSRAKKVIQEVWPDSQKDDDNRAAERLVQEFHELDKSGQGFRYRQSKHGEKLLPSSTKDVDMENLQRKFEGLYNFCEACITGIDDALQNMGSY